MVWINNKYETLGSTSDTMDATSMTASQFGVFLNHGIPSGGDTQTSYSVNGVDSSSNSKYAFRTEKNGATDTTLTNQDKVIYDTGGESDDKFSVTYACDIAGEEKLFYGFGISRKEAGGGNAPTRSEVAWKYVTTSARVTSVRDDTSSQSGTYAVGSNLSCLSDAGVSQVEKDQLTNVPTGTLFEETDTRKMYRFSKGTTPTFSDDMDSSSGWTQVADDTAPSITGGKLVGTDIVLNNENRIHKAIGTTLSDTAWILRAKLTIEAPNNNNGYFYPIVVSNGNGDFNQATSVDMIFFLVDSSSATGYFRSQDGTTQTNVATGQGHVATFWIDIIRDGSTMRLKGYTSEANQISGTTSFNVNFTISGTVSGLDTIQSGASDFNTATQSWSIDWIKVYNGVTSASFDRWIERGTV